jgi:hypothetical protein
MVSEIAEFNPVDTAIDRDSRRGITKLALPFEIGVFAFRSEVMTYLVRSSFSFINEVDRKRIRC